MDKDDDGPQNEGWMGRRWPWLLAVALVLLFNGAFSAWLLIKPGKQALFLAVDNIGQCVGLLLAVALCFAGLIDPWWRARTTPGAACSGADTPRRWGPALLGVGILSEALGQVIYTYYEQFLHEHAPFPSWADAIFLAAIPFLMLGILLLPTRPLPLASRTRIFMDGLMIMTAMATFSWYFVLGPNVLAGAETTLAKVVSVAYPLCDLVLVFCLFLLAGRANHPALRLGIRLLSLALSIVVVTDSVFGYESLHGAYATGSVIDAGWPLGYMLLGLGVFALCRGMRAASLQAGRFQAHDAGRAMQLWRSLLPYALAPAVGILAIYTLNAHGDEDVQPGVFIGGVVLIGLLLLRQVLAIVENNRLYRQLEAKNREMMDHASDMEQLNEELRATQDELQANNAALIEANTRLQALATTDPLTNLPNHRAMVAALDQEIERARRYGRPCAVLFMDIDHFKALNDTSGHPAGDAALYEFGSVVQQALRGVDILGRWGGEEFVALLPETDAAAALDVAERVRAAVAAHAFAAGSGVRLTCSLGAASYPHDAAERDGLINAADRAMYAAKRLGRNQARAADDPAVDALSGQLGEDGSREETALIGTVEALAGLVEARDHYTGQHTQEVAALSVRVAMYLGLDTTEARLVGLAARLHDIGKVAVPDAVLQKPARLSEEEWVLMRAHPIVGADVVSRVPALRVLPPLIRSHHEHWDGRGYPDALAGEAIPLGARIIAVVDAYGAMTTDRPYRQAHDAVWALAELRRCAGAQFDPTVVEAVAHVLTADPSLSKSADAA